MPSPDLEPPTGRRLIAGTAGVGLLGLLLWSRLAGLGQSLWYDEVLTVVEYASSPAAAFTRPYTPNNHVLFSVLTAVTADLLGEEEAVYRLWAVIPGIASVAVTSWWCWRRFGAAVGLGVGAFLTMSPLHVELSRQARGYGLAFLAMAGLVVGAAEFVREARPGPALLLAVSGTVGVMTVPVFVLPFAAAVVFVTVATRDGSALRLLTLAGLVSLLWYAPVLGDLAASTGQEFGELLGPVQVVARPVVDLVAPTFGLIADGIPGVVWILLAYILAAVALLRPGGVPRAGWSTLGGAILATYALLAVLRFHTTTRFTSFLLVPAAVLVTVGLVRSVDLGPRWRRSIGGTVALAAVVVLTASFLSFAREVAATPREDFAAVAEVVDAVDDPVVLTNSRRPLGLRYYLDEELVLVDPSSQDRLCTTAPPLVYVEHRYLSPDLDESCLEERGARHVRVPQRTRGLYLDVWVRTGE